MSSIFDQDPGLGLVGADAVRGSSRARMGAIDRQAAVLALDLSASMRPHLSALSASVREFHASVGSADGMDLAAIGFSSRAWTLATLSKSSEFRIDEAAFRGHDSTYYDKALEAAETVVDEALARPEIAQLKPIVIMFSDGAPNGPDFLPFAARLKTKADVVGLSLGGAATDALRAVASGPEFVEEAANTQALKRFFAVLGSSISASKRARMSLGESVAAGLDLFGSRRR